MSTQGAPGASLALVAECVRTHRCNLAAEHEALGVDLAILDMGADTSTPIGRLLFTVLAGVTEFERETSWLSAISDKRHSVK